MVKNVTQQLHNATAQIQHDEDENVKLAKTLNQTEANLKNTTLSEKDTKIKLAQANQKMAEKELQAHKEV